MAQFVGIIHKDSNSDYSVSFPDFAGCITAGSSLQEAYEMSKEALKGHIATMVEFGDALPKNPLTIDEVKKHEFAKNAETFFVVDAYLPSKKKRTNITLDIGLIKSINSVTDNLSAFLQEAAIEKLHHI
jgi:predicted RNase H-like HicB family nuclease